MRFLVLILALILAANSAPQAPGTVRVRLVTSAGNIVLALDARRAPKTVANFMAYVDDERLDNTEFYRATRRKSDPRFGFIQGGIAQDARRMLPPLPLEPTNQTGITHQDGTISMAHGINADAANANFSIMVGPNPASTPSLAIAAMRRSARSSAAWTWSSASWRCRPAVGATR